MTASKLGMIGAWADTTLADDLGLVDAHEDELYEAPCRRHAFGMGTG